jgi:hypothetical protein
VRERAALEVETKRALIGDPAIHYEKRDATIKRIIFLALNDKYATA